MKNKRWGAAAMVMLCMLLPMASLAQSVLQPPLLTVEVNVGSKKNKPDATQNFSLYDVAIRTVRDKQYLQIAGSFTSLLLDQEEPYASLSVLDAFCVNARLMDEIGDKKDCELSYPLGKLYDSNVLMKLDGVKRQSTDVLLSYSLPYETKEPYIELEISSLANEEAQTKFWQGKIDEMGCHEVKGYSVYSLDESGNEIQPHARLYLYKGTDETTVEPVTPEGYNTPEAARVKYTDWEKQDISISPVTAQLQFENGQFQWRYSRVEAVEQTSTPEQEQGDQSFATKASLSDDPSPSSDPSTPVDPSFFSGASTTNDPSPSPAASPAPDLSAPIDPSFFSGASTTNDPSPSPAASPVPDLSTGAAENSASALIGTEGTASMDGTTGNAPGEEQKSTGNAAQEGGNETDAAQNNAESGDDDKSYEEQYGSLTMERKDGKVKVTIRLNQAAQEICKGYDDRHQVESSAAFISTLADNNADGKSGESGETIAFTVAADAVATTFEDIRNILWDNYQAIVKND